jgi:hypothetical protein
MKDVEGIQGASMHRFGGGLEERNENPQWFRSGALYEFASAQQCSLYNIVPSFFR